jgi:hypothetical protein
MSDDVKRKLAAIEKETKRKLRGEKEQELQRLEQAHGQGSSWALFGAILACDAYDLPVPRWVVEGLANRFLYYLSGEVRGFGEAFGITRPKGWSQPKHRKRWKHMPALYWEVQDERMKGEELKAACDIVGERRGFSAKDVERMHAEWEQVLADRSGMPLDKFKNRR